MNIDKDKQLEFREYVLSAVKEGLSLIIEKKPKPHGHFKWPTMHFSSDGFPSISTGFFYDGPPDYDNVFLGDKPALPTTEIPSFQNLIEFIRENYIFLECLFPLDSLYDENKGKKKDSLYNILIYKIPIAIINRYIHIYGTMEFNEEKFDQIYDLLAHSFFDEILPVDIHIPILFTKFDFDVIELSDSASIERMTDPFHLARYSIKNFGSGVHETVLSKATHCLVLKNFSLQNRNYFSLLSVFSNPQNYPLKLINDFFAAIRLITGVDTGYCQLILQPIGWAIDFFGDLPSLVGTSIKEYPSWFDNYHWLKEEFPSITIEAAKEIGCLFVKLQDIEEKSVQIAIDRLNLCFLRVHDEDSILDATIGLESLLSDDNHQETTHKLAMRIGALAKAEKYPNRTPYQVFKDIKYIYGYRSSVVHGSSKPEKKKEIKLDQNLEIPTSKLALDYLQFSIKALVNNPNFRNPEYIDEILLLSNGESK